MAKAKAVAQQLGEVLGEVFTKYENHPSLHLRLLDAFAPHSSSASSADGIDLLKHLRKAMDLVRGRSNTVPQGPKQALVQWRGQCTDHDAFQLLHRALLTDVDKLSEGEISRAYNQLRRLGFEPEAKALWPALLLKLQSMGVRELMGIWSVAPEEHLAEVDALLIKALEVPPRKPRGSEAFLWPRTSVLLSAVSRAGDLPTSATVRFCLKKLEQRFKDLSSEDLALVVSQLGRGAPEEEFGELARRAKGELLLRDSRLEPLQLCGLLGAMDPQDELWPMVRERLTKMAVNLSAQQLLQICRFVPQPAQEENSLLMRSVHRQLQQLLNRRDQPGLVSMVDKNLESVMHNPATCKELLVGAVRLKKDLYPAILWRLFIHTGEVDLIGLHPKLRPFLKNVGTVLEKSGKLERLTLVDMTAVADAMRKADVLLPNCTALMAEQFAEVLARAEEMASGPASAETEHWLVEAQRLALVFWTRLKQLGFDSPTLEPIMKGICGGGCRLDTMLLAKALAELEGVSGVDSAQQALKEQISIRLRGMSQNDLVLVASLALTEELRQEVAVEAGRRLSCVSALRRAEDFDNAVKMLLRFISWVREAPLAPATPQLLERTAQLLSDALPAVLMAEPEHARRRLVAAVNVLSQLEPTVRPSLCSGVHGEATRGGAWPSSDAADLAYGVCALHGGTLPLDIGLRLWRLAGAALATGSPPAHQSARLWAFAAAARNLSSLSMRAALSMTEEAVAMEAFLKRAQERLLPAQEATATALMSRVCAVLPRLLPEQLVEERFAVPEAPYVVDAALGRALLMVPRAEHLGAAGINGPGKLLQRTVEAMGWQLRWLWPDQWGAALDALEHEGKEEELRGLLGAAREEAVGGSM